MINERSRSFAFDSLRWTRIGFVRVGFMERGWMTGMMGDGKEVRVMELWGSGEDDGVMDGMRRC